MFKTGWIRLIIAAAVIAAFAGGGTALISSALAQNAPQILGATADDCSSTADGTSCMSGLCVDAWPFGHVCSNYCLDDSQCPAAWSCVTMREPSGAEVSFCRPQRVVPGP